MTVFSDQFEGPKPQGGAGGIFTSTYFPDVKQAAIDGGVDTVARLVNGSGDAIVDLALRAYNGHNYLVQAGPCRYDRVTASQRGKIASGSGSNWVMDAGHNMPASGTLLVASVASGTGFDTFGGRATFTVSGNDLTLTSSLTGAWVTNQIGVGDWVFVEGVSELEIPLDVLLYAGNLGSYFTGSALRSLGGVTMAHLIDGSLGVDAGNILCQRMPFTTGRLKVISATPSAGQGGGFGHCRGYGLSEQGAAGCIVHNGTQWRAATYSSALGISYASTVNDDPTSVEVSTDCWGGKAFATSVNPFAGAGNWQGSNHYYALDSTLGIGSTPDWYGILRYGQTTMIALGSATVDFYESQVILPSPTAGYVS